MGDPVQNTNIISTSLSWKLHIKLTEVQLTSSTFAVRFYQSTLELYGKELKYWNWGAVVLTLMPSEANRLAPSTNPESGELWLSMGWEVMVPPGEGPTTCNAMQCTVIGLLAPTKSICINMQPHNPGKVIILSYNDRNSNDCFDT